MQLRIYTYKITFEEVPYYYYGVHKEKVFNEEYWGTPYVNKWCWELYTPKKQILELFDYNDNGWLEANLVEDRLIRPFYQTDKYCLNESCGGRISLQILQKNGKRIGKVYGKMSYENKFGLFSLTDEEKRIVCSRGGKKGAKTHRKKQIGFYAQTMEERIINGKKGGKKGGLIVSHQRWQCTETGFVANAGNLAQYQRKRGIDTSKRIRIE